MESPGVLVWSYVWIPSSPLLRFLVLEAQAHSYLYMYQYTPNHLYNMLSGKYTQHSCIGRYLSLLPAYSNPFGSQPACSSVYVFVHAKKGEYRKSKFWARVTCQ